MKRELFNNVINFGLVLDCFFFNFRKFEIVEILFIFINCHREDLLNTLFAEEFFKTDLRNVLTNTGIKTGFFFCVFAKWNISKAKRLFFFKFFESFNKSTDCPTLSEFELFY